MWRQSVRTSSRLRLGVVMLVVAGLVSMTGCSGSRSPQRPSPAPSAMNPAAEPYHNVQDGYSITPPPGWRYRPITPQLGVSAFFAASTADSTGQKPFVDNLNVVISATDVDLDTAVIQNKQEFPNNFLNYQLTTDESVTLPDRRPGHLLGGTYDQPDVGSLRNLQLFVVNAGHEYVVTATTPTASFARYEPLLRASLLSFALT